MGWKLPCDMCLISEVQGSSKEVKEQVDEPEGGVDIIPVETGERSAGVKVEGDTHWDWRQHTV